MAAATRSSAALKLLPDEIGVTGIVPLKTEHSMQFFV